MRKLTAFATAVLLAIVLAGPAAADPNQGTCWVTPDPVPVHTTFTVYGTGLAPSVTYWAWLMQPSNDAPGSAPMFGTTTIADGTFTLAIDADVAAYGHPLEPGSVHVRLAAASVESNQSPSARCGFQVV
jgi:hypothetical protein